MQKIYISVCFASLTKKALEKAADKLLVKLRVKKCHIIFWSLKNATGNVSLIFLVDKVDRQWGNLPDDAGQGGRDEGGVGDDPEDDGQPRFDSPPQWLRPLEATPIVEAAGWFFNQQYWSETNSVQCQALVLL